MAASIELLALWINVLTEQQRGSDRGDRVAHLARQQLIDNIGNKVSYRSLYVSKSYPLLFRSLDV